MKLPLTLFSLCCFYCGITAYSDKCMKRDYEPRAEDDLKKQFETGFSLLNLAKSIMSSIFIRNPGMWKFCACALYKRSQLKSKNKGTTVRSYEEILQNVKITDLGYIPVDSPHRYWFNLKHQAAFVICQYDQDTCAIVKGFQQKSYFEPIYDLYIGTPESKPGDSQKKTATFEGIIEDVNVRRLPN